LLHHSVPSAPGCTPGVRPRTPTTCVGESSQAFRARPGCTNGVQGGVALRLIIADDDALARALIEAIVERDRELELVGSAEDAERAIELAKEHQPDVAVLDWVMPGRCGE